MREAGKTDGGIKAGIVGNSGGSATERVRQAKLMVVLQLAVWVTMASVPGDGGNGGK